MADWKERILKKKWKRLEAEGLERPKDAEENRRRANEAHQNLEMINVHESERSEQECRRRAEKGK
jgi:hypothetical protein